MTTSNSNLRQFNLAARVNHNPEEQFADIKAINEGQDKYAAAEAAKASRAASHQRQNQFYKDLANNKEE